MKFILVLSFVKINPCYVTFCTSNPGYQNKSNLDHCSLKIYPLTMFPNQTDNGNKSHCDTLWLTNNIWYNPRKHYGLPNMDSKKCKVGCLCKYFLLNIFK